MKERKKHGIHLFGNRRWKKAISLMLAGTMAVSLAACGNGAEEVSGSAPMRRVREMRKKC